MVENRILRQNARMQLGNSIFHSKWITMLGVCAVLSIVATAGATPAVGIILLLLTGTISYGIARTTVECVEGKKWDFTHVFCGFSECLGKSVILGLLQGLFTFLWSLLFILPGIVKSYSYAMCFYIQQERPDTEPVDCITESRQMMDGYKWQLFCLDFSFFGWYLLGALCLGVGVFFVTPYHQTARANFFEALKAEKALNLPHAAETSEERTTESTPSNDSSL